jgi:DNA-binding NtrC family response regulator
MNVLIVERDTMMAEVFADALAEQGIEAEIIGDDKDAVAACRPDSPQVVITSINRRQEDLKGCAIVRAMRDRCPRLSAIFMAAVRPARPHVLGKRERFLAKPVSMVQFVRTVRELLPA